MTLRPALSRALGAGRARVWLGAGAAAALLLALAPGDLGPVSARAALAVLALVGAAALLRARGRPPAPPAAIEVLAQRPLSREAGVAVVDVEGRRLLLGFGADGVRLLYRLDPPSQGEPK